MYLIPLVLLIVVLLVLKKRQDSQASAKPKRTANTGKTTKTPSRTNVVEEPVSVPKTATPLAPELRQKIETLIKEDNFFAAEAQINQALNRDNSQHDLYLLLLDIHTKQKDDFAITQLINHIRVLGLSEVLAKAEAKRIEYEEANKTSNETMDFGKSIDTVPTTQTLVDDKAFDALQDEIKPSTKSVFEAKPTQNDIKPLEFNFDSSFTQLDTKVEPVKEETATQEAAPVADLSFDLDPSPKIEEAPAAPTLEFKLDDIKPAEPVAPAQEEIQPLDFSFSLDSVPAVEEKVEPITLDLNTENLDTPAPTAEPSTLDFKLDSLEPKQETPSTGIQVAVPETPVSKADQNDPLVQSFPELIDNDEISLNIVLAEQYIKLGAYDAARELLAEKESQYSAEQKQQVSELLNQIAS